MRTELKGKWGKIVMIIAVCAALFHLYTAIFGVFTPRMQRSLHLGFLLPLCFLLFPATGKSCKEKPTRMDILFSIVSVVVFCLYILWQKERIDTRWFFVDKVLLLDLVMGTAAICLLIEATRRAVAPAMAVLAVIAILYLFLGSQIPGVFGHRGFTFTKVVEMNYLGIDLEGIFGTLTAISSTFVAVFVLFGAFVSNTSVGTYFNDLAIALAGKTAGGPAKVAVISSGLFGMVSGIGASNVYTTGTFTIPSMKEYGFKPEFAGGVEAAASTGGQYMPPVMGAAAFIMSELTGVPYLKICLAAFLSGLLYYFTLLLMVHYRALKFNLVRSQNKQKSSDWKMLLKKSYLFIPILAIVILMFLGYSPLFAAYNAIIVTIVIGIITKELDFWKIVCAMQEGTVNTIMIAIACACAGLIMGTITHTGLGLSFTSAIVTLSKGNLVLALMLVMCSCMLLGMGLPASAAYVMAATLAAPALLALGMDLLASHLFVYYFAIFASLTPPVAVCAYAAASIAKSNPTKTGIEAFKLGIAGLFVPYAFIMNNALILKGTFFEVAFSGILAVVGLFFVAKGVIGFFNRPISWERQFVFRAAYVIIGVTILFFPVMVL